MSGPETLDIGGRWTTYRRADGELIGGEYAFTTDADWPDWPDESDEATEVIVETWELVWRVQQRMGPLGLCAWCEGEGEVPVIDVDTGEPHDEPCPVCQGTGEEVRP